MVTLCADGPAVAAMRAIMATSANELFSTVNRLMPKLLDAAEAEALLQGAVHVAGLTHQWCHPCCKGRYLQLILVVLTKVLQLSAY